MSDTKSPSGAVFQSGSSTEGDSNQHGALSPPYLGPNMIDGSNPSDSASDEKIVEHRGQSESQYSPYMNGYALMQMKSRASLKSKAYMVNDLKDEYIGGLYILPMDDPRRPHNWSLRKRLAHTVAYGVTTLTAQFGASVLSPTSEQISEQFEVGSEVGVLAFCIYLIGNMFGPALFAPVSELYGRKAGVLMPCFVGSVLLCVCAVVDDIAALVVFRFLAGVFTAAPIAASGGSMADLWTANDRAAAMVLYAANIMIGAVGSPVLGALLVGTGSYGWRWASWLCALLCMVVSVFNLIFLSESFVPVIEQRVARHMRLDTGYWNLHTDHDKWHITFQEFVQVHLMRPILMLVTPIVFCMAFFASFVFGLLYILITSTGAQFREVYGFTYAASYCPLFGYFSGYLFGGAVNIMNSRRYARLTNEVGHKLPPEQRLWAMMICAWFLPAGMFLYGWTMRPDIFWIVPCVGLGMCGVGLSVVFQGALVYLVDVYEVYAASSVAANTMLRCLASGVFALFSNQLYNGLGPGWASTLLGIILAVMVPIPWVFYFFGEKIRKRDPFRKQLSQ